MVKVLAMLLLAAALSTAQESPVQSAERRDSLGGSAAILFDKLLTTYRWNARLLANGLTGPLSFSKLRALSRNPGCKSWHE